MKEYILVTGMSGAGKTKGMKVLEDKGYYCVDNLPLNLVKLFVKEIEENHKEEKKIAISLDIRSLDFVQEIQKIVQDANEDEEWKVMFFDASEDVLIKRYKETRRMHPYASLGSIEQGIKKEKEKLKNIKNKSTYIIDTTNIADKYLKSEIEKVMDVDDKDMIVNIMSFGFKYGLPKDVDMVFDVRMLPNPYYVEELRKETGQNPKVSEYVYNAEESLEYFQKSLEYLQYVLPLYQKEGRKQFIVGVGCTGGKHRSVATAEKFKQKLNTEYNIVLSHRDLGRE